MPTLKSSYSSAWAALAVTNFGALTTGQFWASDYVTNTTALDIDKSCGGMIDSGGTVVTGEKVDIYVGMNYDTATDADTQGGIAGLLDPAGTEGDATVLNGTDFILEQMTLISSIHMDAINLNHHWAVGSLAAAFDGILPERLFFIIHNNTANTLGTGHSIGTAGHVFTST